MRAPVADPSPTSVYPPGGYSYTPGQVPQAPTTSSTSGAPRSLNLPRAEPKPLRKPPRAPKAQRQLAPASPRRRRRWKRWVAAGVVLCLAVPTLLLFFAWTQFNRIERVDVDEVLAAGGGEGTNYLIVGTDTREGIEADDPNAGAFLGEADGGDVSGERTDTLMILRIQGGQQRLLSIPRDLWVTNAVTGDEGRINATFRTGPDALIRTVQESVGIPIHHYLEINFVSFASLVDSVGGITIDFGAPARDQASGLVIEQAGPVTLNGAQALAFVRSRHYEELIDGEYRADPTGDLGRTERQRLFLSALLGKVTGTRNPFELMSISRALGGGLAIDNTITFFGALGLAWNLRGFAPESVVLPTTPRTTSGGAAVLELQEPAASDLVAQFST
jgi:LCP family protein required for cell wall assembly